MSSADIKKQRRAKFEEVYEIAKKDLVDHVASLGFSDDVVQWYIRVRRSSPFSALREGEFELTF
jgi:hypothetical protein